MSLMLQLDQIIFRLINNQVGQFPLIDSFARLIVNEYFVPVTLSLVIFYLWVSNDDKGKQVLPLALISVGLLTLTILISNFFFDRNRPFQDMPVNLLFYMPTDPSFPSNAAAAGFGLAGSIYAFKKGLGVCSLILAFFYGLSRIFAGVHYPLDVIGGSLIGIVAVLIGLRLVEIRKRLFDMIVKIQKLLGISF